MGDRSDPRLGMTADDLANASNMAMPTVGQMGRGRDNLVTVLGMAGLSVIGVVTFLSLRAPQSLAPPAPVVAATTSATAAPSPVTMAATPPPTAVPIQPADAPAQAPAPTPPVLASSPTILLFDVGLPPTAASGQDSGAGIKPSSQQARQVPGQTADELFADRVASGGVEVMRSSPLAAPGATIAEGTIIPALLETAVDTDLSGYVRALVSRDVKSFDGTALLVPRGSRLIGQYRSGLIAGQSRVYIVWSRLIRPDGVSIRLGSPGIDMAGQSGTTGSVDNHDAHRYGPTVMLSLLSGAVNALTSRSSVTISSNQSAEQAASIALQNGVKIGPTIRLPQGGPIQVFVTRDLEFNSPTRIR